MANDDHLARLRLSVRVWNAWREQYPEMTPDLRGGALRGLDLSDTNLAGADLREADLRGTIFRGARLAGARLDGANLFKAILDGADLQNTVLIRAQFLNCAQIVVARNWQSTRRDPSLGCGAAIPQD